MQMEEKKAQEAFQKSQELPSEEAATVEKEISTILSTMGPVAPDARGLIPLNRFI